jgi:hypothetical protein
MVEGLGPLLGSVGGAITGTVLYVLMREARSGVEADIRSRRERKKQRLEQVLDSSDLAVVGGYLDDVIGEFSVYEYAASGRVASVVDRYLDRMRSFLSVDAEIARQAEAAEGPPEVVGAAAPSGELEEALSEVRSGQVWNGLARVRRHIEMRLRGLAKAGGVAAGSRESGGRLLSGLLEAREIDSRTYEALRYAIYVCDGAVHGQEVGRVTAEEAVQLAAAALARLDSPLWAPEG